MTWFLNVSEAGGDLIIWFYQLSCLIRSDEGLMLEMSAFESLHDGQFTLSTQLIKPNYLVILPLTQHHSFFRNLPPLLEVTVFDTDLQLLLLC